MTYGSYSFWADGRFPFQFDLFLVTANNQSSDVSSILISLAPSKAQLFLLQQLLHHGNLILHGLMFINSNFKDRHCVSAPSLITPLRPNEEEEKLVERWSVYEPRPNPNIALNSYHTLLMKNGMGLTNEAMDLVPGPFCKFPESELNSHKEISEGDISFLRT